MSTEPNATRRARRLGLLVAVLAASCAAPAVAGVGARVDAGALPMTGDCPAGMESYDRVMLRLLRKWQVPGAAIAVAKDGHLVMARGYGWADVERQQPVQPDSLFRIASVSKPITSAAVLTLVEQGRLDLDAKALGLLSSLGPARDGVKDPRLRDVTVRHLLIHAGGWDRAKAPDSHRQSPAATKPAQ